MTAGTKVTRLQKAECHGSARRGSHLAGVHVHVGGVVAGHVQTQGIVAGGGAGLRSLTQPRSSVGEPHLGIRSQTSSKTGLSHLDSGLTKLGPLAELLPGVDVRVLRPLEGLLQLVQLVGGEGGAGPSLLPLQGGVMVGVLWWVATLRGIPGSASMSEPSSEPPPSGLTEVEQGESTILLQPPLMVMDLEPLCTLCTKHTITPALLYT